MKVLLGGNGPKEQELKAQIRELGLDDTVRLLGYRTDLERVVPAVDVVVSCSRREGLPLNIVEAMLCEKPIVASTNRGHRELVKDGATGFLLAPDDAAGFSDRIKKLNDDRELRKKFGSKGLSRAQAYTVSRVQKELQMIIDNCVLS